VLGAPLSEKIFEMWVVFLRFQKKIKKVLADATPEPVATACKSA
jgi:hypothetical protein